MKPNSDDKNTNITNINWHLMVDEYSGYKISCFYATKNGMVEPTCQQYQLWKSNDKPVHVVQQDNASENKILESRCSSADWKLNIKFEYTARNMPQQNHLVEVGFATIAGQGRAMMSHANLPGAIGDIKMR